MENSKTFINENNNEVTFGVSGNQNEVILSAEGPESNTEWTITYLEARELYKLLGESLDSLPSFIGADYYHG